MTIDTSKIEENGVPDEGGESPATPPHSTADAGLDAALAAASNVPVPRLSASKFGADPATPNGSPKRGRSSGGSGPADFHLGDEVELATQLLNDLRGDSPEPVLYDRSEFWRFDPDDNLWHPVPEHTVYVHVSRYSGRRYPNARGNLVPLKMSATKIEGTLRIARQQAKQVALAREPTGMFFDRAPRGMATKDKFLRLLEGDIVAEPLTAAHRQTVCLPFEWDESATCPQWDSFYREVFANCPEAEAGLRQQSLDEMIGACLFGIATDYQTCFILHGGGSNGKGTWQKVVVRMFPKEFVSMMSPKDMLSSRFALAGLVGRRLNIVGELPAEAMFEEDKLKAIIAGDEMSTEQKFGAVFSFVPQAGLVYSCNALPKNRDQSYGFYRRFIIVTFQQQFTGSAIKIKYEEQLATELPGIFARTVAAVRQLVRRGHYAAPDCSREEIEEWKEDSDPVHSFVNSCCVVDKKAESPLLVLYAAYLHWWEQVGGRKLSAQELGQGLKKMGYWHKTKSARFYRLSLRESGMAGSVRKAAFAKAGTP